MEFGTQEFYQRSTPVEEWGKVGQAGLELKTVMHA